MTKEIKYIDKVKRPVVRPCPCAIGHQSCNYIVISHILNCPYNCSYCFLHTFYGKDDIVVLKEEEKIVNDVKKYMTKANESLHFGTGQFSDSLALPDALSLGKKLIKLFAAQDKHLFELKTKSNNIDELLLLKHNGHTVIAWSVNPEGIVKSDELGAVSLAERLEAAEKCARAGYPVAFHFDPIIYYDGWENDYKAVVDLIFAKIKPSQIAWISLGALRFDPRLKDIIKERFPQSIIKFDKSKLGEDGKMRYLKPIRIELFKKMQQFIRNHSKEVLVYLCMEHESMWQAVNIINSDKNKYKRYLLFSTKQPADQ